MFYILNKGTLWYMIKMSHMIYFEVILLWPNEKNKHCKIKVSSMFFSLALIDAVQIFSIRCNSSSKYRFDNWLHSFFQWHYELFLFFPLFCLGQPLLILGAASKFWTVLYMYLAREYRIGWEICQLISTVHFRIQYKNSVLIICLLKMWY